MLLGHSFGGATVRLLSRLLAEGDEVERKETHPKDLSPLFEGGMEKRIFAIVTLAAPTNGTVSYDMYDDPLFDTEDVEIPLKYEMLNRMMRLSTGKKKKDRDPEDSAAWDMTIDHAAALNKTIPTLAETYYFSVACTSTIWQEDGTAVPDPSITEGMFIRSSTLLGKYKGVSRGGIILDESWRENDGLVNTVSARAPIGAPQKQFERSDITKGVWNILPDYHGDHSSLQGGFTKKHDPRPFYEDLMKTIESLK